MSIVDLSKARAYADSLEETATVDYGRAGADWIRELADEVESLQRAIESARRSELAALADAAKLRAERDAAVLGLQEIHRGVSAMLREARHVADNHPDPAASGAAMRILGSAS